MNYKEIIFQDIKEALNYYKELGFNITKDSRVLLNYSTEIEVILKKLGPSMIRSSIIVRETP